MIYKTLKTKQKIVEHEPHYKEVKSCDPEGWTVPAPLVTPVMSLSNVIPNV